MRRTGKRSGSGSGGFSGGGLGGMAYLPEFDASSIAQNTLEAVSSGGAMFVVISTIDDFEDEEIVSFEHRTPAVATASAVSHRDPRFRGH